MAHLGVNTQVLWRIYVWMNKVSIGLSNSSVPSHRLNWSWFIVNGTLMNKHQWILNQNTKLIFQIDKYIWKYRLKKVSHFVLVSVCYR